ncbi:DUF4179 domain-containing protein [Bacillus sp. AK128]
MNGTEINPFMKEKTRKIDVSSLIDWLDSKKDEFYKAALLYLKDDQQVQVVFNRVIKELLEEKQPLKGSVNTSFTHLFIKECKEVSTNEFNSLEGETLTKLSQLNESYKDAIILKYILHLPYDEVSDLLQIPIETVKSHLLSGIQLLQDEVEDSSENESCIRYQASFVDYLDMTLGRRDQIALEIHIHKCDSCNNRLYLLQQAYLTLCSELDEFMAPSTIMDGVSEFIEAAVKKSENQRKKRIIKSTAIASILAMVILLGVVSNGFNYMYYTWLDWNQSEDEEMLAYLKGGLGEPLNIVSEHNGVKVTIKTAIADDYQTLIFYEVEDTKNEQQKYAINMFEGIYIENESEVFSSQNHHLARLPFEGKIIERGEKKVFSGKLSLLPISDESGTIKLKVSRLTEVNGELSELYENYQVEGLEGDWSVEIPVTKQASIEHIVNQEVEVDGTPVTIEKIIFAPTVTMLQYIYEHYTEESGFVHDIHLDRIVKGDSQAPFYNFYNMDDQSGAYIKSFDSLYFEKSKDINIYFSSIHYGVGDEVSFDLNANENSIQTFEYLDHPLTLESENNGNQTKFILTLPPPRDRRYESLNFEFRTDNESEMLNMNYNHVEWVMIDREGKELKEDEYNYYEIFEANKEQPTYYPIKYEIELIRDSNVEQTFPTKLLIHGYDFRKYIDESVDVELD